MEDKVKFCYSCGTSKPFSEYYLNKGIPEKFCKSCCKTYTAKERQTREFNLIFGILRNIKGIEGDK